MYKEKSFDQLKEEEIRIATELCYSKKVIEKLEKAKTKSELYLIMTTARQNLED